MLKELEPIAAKLKEERLLLNRALDRMTDDQVLQANVNPEWTIKDALAHLAGAERGMLKTAERMARGEDPQLPQGYSNDEFNARQVAKRKAMSLAQLRAELDATRADLMSFLDGVTREQLDLRGEHPLAGETTLKDLLVIIYSHESQHCKDIVNQMHELKK